MKADCEHPAGRPKKRQKIMAHLKSAIKRMRTSREQNARNRARKSTLKTVEKKFRAAVAAGDAANDKNLQEVAQILGQHWQVKHLLISLAAQGMALFNQDGSSTVIPTRASEVYDVSGAGDTVVATTALAMAAGADARNAAELANYAAGVVVRQLGTATVSAEELREALAGK